MFLRQIRGIREMLNVVLFSWLWVDLKAKLPRFEAKVLYFGVSYPKNFYSFNFLILQLYLTEKHKGENQIHTKISIQKRINIFKNS